MARAARTFFIVASLSTPKNGRCLKTLRLFFNSDPAEKWPMLIYNDGNSPVTSTFKLLYAPLFFDWVVLMQIFHFVFYGTSGMFLLCPASQKRVECISMFAGFHGISAKGVLSNFSQCPFWLAWACPSLKDGIVLLQFFVCFCTPEAWWRQFKSTVYKWVEITGNAAGNFWDFLKNFLRINFLRIFRAQGSRIVPSALHRIWWNHFFSFFCARCFKGNHYFFLFQLIIKIIWAKSGRTQLGMESSNACKSDSMKCLAVPIVVRNRFHSEECSYLE